MVKIVVDSYAWIEIFLGSSLGERAKKALEEGEQVFTPGTVLAEVARKYLWEGVEEGTIVKRLFAISGGSELQNVEAETALEAGKAFLELQRRARDQGLEKPSLFDGVILAVARVLGAKVITGDRHFKGLPETIGLGD